VINVIVIIGFGNQNIIQQRKIKKIIQQRKIKKIILLILLLFLSHTQKNKRIRLMKMETH